MARTSRQQAESGVYHIMLRGEGRRILFEDDDDRRCFLRLLENAIGDCHAHVFAWCLMSNHVHLLVKVDFDLLPRMMQSITSGYAVYYNKEHDHVGHVFAGRYKSKPVESDEYLLQLVRYIHLNPVKDGLSDTCRYRWSSYNDYLAGSGFVQTEFVLGVCGGLEQFESYHDGREGCGSLQVTGFRPRLSDAEAQAVARKAFGEQGEDRLKALGSLAKGERNDGIAVLRRAGLSARQIERLTGISRGIISRVAWK